MSEGALRGFWMAARDDPERVAVIDPDGREWTAGELLQGADQLVHAPVRGVCASVTCGDAHRQPR